LIEGWYASEYDGDVVVKYTKTGNIYNEYISNG
jgi:hypothetical protein